MFRLTTQQARCIVDTVTSTSPPPAFHSDDVENVANYRSLSVLALLSLVLGLFSTLSLVFTLFLGVVLLGLIVSLIALRQISLSEGRLAGRWAAVLGLILCVTCGVATMSRGAAIRYLRTSQAQQYARNWLSVLVAGKTTQAFRGTLEGNQPPPMPEPGMPPRTTTPLDDFKNDELIKKIAAAGEDAKIDYAGTYEYVAQSRRDYFLRQRYVITPQPGSKARSKPIRVNVAVQRSRLRGDAKPRWLITKFESTNAPAK
jgi:hypothetical protein